MSGHKGHARLRRSDLEHRKPFFYEEMGKVLRIAREAAGLSRAKLAAKAGLSESAVDAIELGRNCSLIAFILIADSLGLGSGPLGTPSVVRLLREGHKDEAAA